MLRWLLALGLATLAFQAHAAAEAPSGDYRFSYEAYYSGFKIGEADSHLQWGRSRYTLALHARTAGMLGWFMSIDQSASSEGRLAPLPRAEHHRNHNADGDNRNWVELAFTPDGARVVAADPDPATEARSPVPAGLLKGVLDPLSAAFALSLKTSEAGRCQASVPVFDGRRRYDTVLEDRGRETYTGPAGPRETLRCAFHFVRLAGYRPNAKRWKGITGTLWMQKLDASLPLLPVRVEIDTSYGTAFVHMVSASDRR
ncbi:MAG: DUF3108 domain-containing protein [Alphaproteobacteria bacterium]|nr:DUF3108 domain-containing protein [Alphaproteobacteria bacterium]MCB9931235.1 DUF3108 domain-containing protein [Alphaproteobacteria bacterium]